MSSFFSSSLSKKLVIRVNEIFVFIKADNTVGNTVSGNLNMLNSAIDTNAVFASKTLLESIKTNVANDTMATTSGTHSQKLKKK